MVEIAVAVGDHVGEQIFCRFEQRQIHPVLFRQLACSNEVLGLIDARSARNKIPGDHAFATLLEDQGIGKVAEQGLTHGADIGIAGMKVIFVNLFCICLTIRGCF